MRVFNKRFFKFHIGDKSDEEILEEYKNKFIKEPTMEIAELRTKNPQLLMKLPLSYKLHHRMFLAFSDEPLKALEDVFKNIHIRTFLDYAFNDPYTLSDSIIAFLECNFEDLEFIEYSPELWETSPNTKMELKRRDAVIQDMFTRIKKQIESEMSGVIYDDTMSAVDTIYEEYILYEFPF